MSNSTAKTFDVKALALNALIVALCSAPVLGWVCFMLVVLVYSIAAYRTAASKAGLQRSVSAIALSVIAYFSTYWLHGAVEDRYDYIWNVALAQVAVVLALVLYFHFQIYKPRWDGMMARLAGIEPTTLGFGGQYSIHWATAALALVSRRVVAKCPQWCGFSGGLFYQSFGESPEIVSGLVIIKDSPGEPATSRIFQ
jgi:uncharacterized protein (DUF486 family)